LNVIIDFSLMLDIDSESLISLIFFHIIIIIIIIMISTLIVINFLLKHLNQSIILELINKRTYFTIDFLPEEQICTIYPMLITSSIMGFNPHCFFLVLRPSIGPLFFF
jgi:hypothetical protein